MHSLVRRIAAAFPEAADRVGHAGEVPSEEAEQQRESPLIRPAHLASPG
jgi:hypothetical protein